MKKLNPKFLLLRPSYGFLPLGLLIASALNHSDGAALLFSTLLISRLLALASATGLRQAFARQPSMRMARGSVKLALLLQPVGAALAAGLWLLLRGRGLPEFSPYLMGAALLLNFEQVFYEYLTAAGEGHSAGMARGITAVLVCGGLMMGEPLWTLGEAAVSAVVTAVIALMIGGPLKGKLNGEVVKCAPWAMLQCAVYPAVYLIAVYALKGKMGEIQTAVPFFAGLTLYELWRTPFRRSALEARPMNAVLGMICAAAAVVIGVSLLPGVEIDFEVIAAAGMLILSAVCVWGVYGRFGKEE